MQVSTSYNSNDVKNQLCPELRPELRPEVRFTGALMRLLCKVAQIVQFAVCRSTGHQIILFTGKNMLFWKYVLACSLGVVLYARKV